VQMNDNEYNETIGESAGAPVNSVYDVFATLRHPVCVIGIDGNLMYSNGPFRDLFGGEQSIQLDLTNPFFPEYRKRVALAYIRARKGFERQCFAVMQSSSGKKLPLEIQLFPMYAHGEVAAILTFFKPVADNRLVSFDRPATSLADWNEMQGGNNIFEYSPFPIIRINRRGEILNGSSSLESFFGHSLQEMQSKRNLLFKSVPLYDFERLRKATVDVITGAVAFKRLGEIRVTTGEKEEKWVNVIIYPCAANKEIHAVDMILEDFTRVRRLENRMSVFNRIQIIGDLTKGLLHSFNNMINIIMSRSQLLLQVTEKDIVLDGIREIEQTALDAVKQIRRVQDFIGEGESLRGSDVEDLIEIIEDAIEFTKIHFKVESKEKRRTIKIERRYFNLVSVKTDTRLLREILISMIFKISSFFKKGGTINIVLRGDEVPAISAIVRKEEPEGEAATDTVSPVAFSGIDLRRTAEKLNIKIIEEESADSYSIKAVLPQQMVLAARKKEPEAVEYKLRDHDIMIVEDEKALTDILHELFDSMGNRVYMCDSSDEALAEFRKGKYNLVITDYGIRGVTGLELAARIKEIDSNVTTVLLSGWMLNDLKAHKNVIDLFLPKPFKLEVLISEISRVLRAKKR